LPDSYRSASTPPDSYPTTIGPCMSRPVWPMASPHEDHTTSVQPQQAETSRVAFYKQFYKTEKCRYYPSGCTKGSSCPFAHGEEELRPAPDLTKTSLCQAWVDHSCPLTAEECPFAHGWSEKRANPIFMKHAAQQTATRRARRKRRSARWMSAESETAGETPQAPPSPAGIAPLSFTPLGQAFIVCPVVVGMVHQVQPATGMATGPSANAPRRAMQLAPPTVDVAAWVSSEVPSRVNARARASVPGRGEHVGMALTSALRAGHSQALTNILEHAVPDHYED